MRKVMILMFAVLFCVPFSVWAEKLTDNEVHNFPNISAIHTSEGTKVFYRNVNDGGRLYVYDDTTGTNTKLSNNSIFYISAINTANGVKVYYRNANDAGSLYVYEWATKTNRKLNSTDTLYVSAISTNNGAKVFYRNGSDSGNMYLYDEATGTTRRVNRHSTAYISVIKTTGVNVRVYYSNVGDGGSLYYYDEATGTTKKLNSVNSTYISAISTPTGTKVFYRNASDGGSLYYYDEATDTNRKLNTAGSLYISAIYTSEGVKVYYSNESENGSLYVYNLTKGTNTKLNNSKSLYVSAVNTDEGAQIYYRNDGDGGRLYVYRENIKKIEEVAEVTEIHGYTWVELSWKNPSHENLEKVIIYQDARKIKEVHVPDQQYRVNGLKPDTVYTFKLTTSYGSGIESPGVTITVKTDALPDVQNISYTVSHDEVRLFWKNPSYQTFSGIHIYQGNRIILSNFINETYTVRGLTPETPYNFIIKTVDTEGNESEGQNVQVVTLEEPKTFEVKNIHVRTTHERVDLSWTLPNSPYFRHVNIYRDTVKEANRGILAKIKEFFLGTEVMAANTKIFETNGTYFNDYTVQPGTTYEYTLTTTNTNGQESNGVTVVAKTGSSPSPEIKNVQIKETNDGYIIRWDEPTKGTVEILIGENVHGSVPASDREYFIPKNEMKYDSSGQPLVSIRAVSTDGVRGEPIRAIKNTLPFSASDLLRTGMGILWLVAPILLLTLAFLLFPRLREVIIRAFGRGQRT